LLLERKGTLLKLLLPVALFLDLSPEEDEEFSEPPTPSAERVAQRAIVLSVVACRGVIDGQRANLQESADLTKRAYDWLRARDLQDELSDWERRILNSPFGTLADRDRINASWLSEAVMVLAWSLGKLELPGFSEQCDPASAANSLGFLQPTDLTVLRNPELRSPADLHEYNEFIYNVHWRLRDFSVNRRSYNFESLARKAWGDPVLRHGLLIREKDICIGGVPISQASERDLRTVTSITQERHRASNWLIGYASEDFYEVTTDT
jgi:Domain of unknown function (DUF4272)